MWVYKITNILNNKVYIGQSIRPVEERFKRHINDAMNGTLDTHFARAIRKYGAENFRIEIIDEASNQDELNSKEQFWIREYDAVNSGYNETDALYKCGGNTYNSKTPEEIEEIKQKIRTTKIGSKNPMARKIKRINVVTSEIDYFETIISCARACGINSGKTSIAERLSGKRTIPLNGKWMFEYCDE